jgi:hypothetical protein
MTNFGQRIEGVISGEPTKITCDVEGVPEGSQLITANLQIGLTPNAMPWDPVVDLHISPDPQPQGQIIDNGQTNGVGTILFNLLVTPIPAIAVLQFSGTSNLKLTAKQPGLEGNAISFTIAEPTGPNQVLSLTLNGEDIIITPGTDPFGNINTTVEELAQLLNTHPDTTNLILAQNYDVGNGPIVPYTQLHLYGGSGGTNDLQPQTEYTYKVYTTLSGEERPRLHEAGTLTPRSADDLSPLTAKHSLAEAAGEGTTRVRNLIDNYLDVILHEFRQLKVWDEHARRSANNPKLLHLTYQNLNPTFPTEVFNGQNERIPDIDYTILHKQGLLRVHTDSGNDDYFVTYSFNYFPAPELQSLLELTLQELNLSGGQGGAPGGFLTYYTDINTAPAYWDAALVFGAASKAFRRLAVDSGLWKNYLIWVSDNNGPNLAREYADYYQAELDSIKSQLKRIFLIARPTIAFQAFRTRGWGAMGLGSSRFRELRLNQIGMY